MRYRCTFDMVVNHTVVWFVVVVLIDRHQGERLGVVVQRHIVLVEVTNQHDCPIINRRAGNTAYSISYIGIYFLTLIGGGAVDLFTCNRYVLSSIAGAIYLIVVRVGHESGIGPVRLDGDASHPVRYVEIGTLREHTITASSSINVFVGTFTIGEVITAPCVGSSICAWSTACHTGNLPTGHNFTLSILTRPLCIVTFTYVIVIRQLHLVVVIVITVEVFIGALESQTCLGKRSTCSCIRAYATDGYCQRSYLATMITSYGSTVGSMLGIVVDDRRIFALRLQHWVGLGIRCIYFVSVSRFQHPLGHLIPSIGHRPSSVEGCQLLVAVEQQTIEFEAGQILVLNGQGTVVLVDSAGLEFVVGIIVEVVQTASSVFDGQSTIYGRDIAARADVAIEHAVHNHSLEVGSSGGVIVITHNTALVRTTLDVGIAEAIDHTRTAIEMSHDTTHMCRTAHATVEDTTVVDAGVAQSRSGDGTGVAFGIAAADVNVLNNHIPHDSTIGIAQKGCRPRTGDRRQFTIYDACKWLGAGSYSVVRVEVGSQDIVTTHSLDVCGLVNNLGDKGEGEYLGYAVGTLFCRTCERSNRLHHLCIVEAGHQTHIAVVICYHHKCGIGDVQRRLVVAFRMLTGS